MKRHLGGKQLVLDTNSRACELYPTEEGSPVPKLSNLSSNGEIYLVLLSSIMGEFCVICFRSLHIFDIFWEEGDIICGKNK